MNSKGVKKGSQRGFLKASRIVDCSHIFSGGFALIKPKLINLLWGLNATSLSLFCALRSFRTILLNIFYFLDIYNE